MTSVQIDGVLHEFSTVPGVLEDVTEIILNLKGLSLKIHSDEEKVLEIDADGDGNVTAGDIRADSDVEILSPDLHIATWLPARVSICGFSPIVDVVTCKRTVTKRKINQSE